MRFWTDHRRRARPAGTPLPCRRRSLQVETLESRQLLTAVNMTDQEQLLLELVNRARANPLAEAARYEIDLNQGLDPGTLNGNFKQPLSPHQALVDAARRHSQDMLDYDYFEHVSPRGDGPNDRAIEAGYPAGAGENIAWFGAATQLQQNAEVYRRHEALFLSPPHRKNMLTAGYREIGNGIKFGEFEGLAAIMVTENFGNRRGDYFITGVAYTDQVVADNFYNIGEGIGALTVTATRHRDGMTFTTTTSAAGGYGLEVPTGAYTVTASGGSMANPITVRDVVILSKNQKVDFNTRFSGLGSVSGQIYHDLDRDRILDAGEPFVAGQIVYLDFDDDGVRSADETSVTTGASGSFRFEGLRAGSYQVRREVAPGWEATAPASEVYAFELPVGQNYIGLNFGNVLVNATPVAQDDQYQTEQDQSLPIDVFANDSDADGDVLPESTRIVVEPQHGEVRLDRAGGQLVYFPTTGFVGSDFFEYTIEDEQGLTSNIARVDLQVTPGPGLDWQNPVNRFDVNGDTHLSSIDVLLILDDLTAQEARRLSPAQPDLKPPPYIDVSGDGFITPIDGLLVLNELNRVFARPSVAAQPEAEPDSQRAVAASLQPLATTTLSLNPQPTIAPAQPASRLLPSGVWNEAERPPSVFDSATIDQRPSSSSLLAAVDEVLRSLADDPIGAWPDPLV